MVAGTRSTEAASAKLSPRGQLGVVARGVGVLLACGVAVQAARVIADNPMMQTLVGAIAVSFITARAGLLSEAATRPALIRSLYGAALGATVGVGALLVAVALGHASLQASEPSWALLLTTLELAAQSYRDEMFLHAVPLLYARRAGAPAWLGVAYAAGAGLAHAASVSPLSLPAVLLVLVSGVFFALVWQQSGDGWAPVGAHLGWLWVCETLVGGELLDARFEVGKLAPGAGAEGPSAWFAALLFLGGAVLVGAARWPRFPPVTLESETAPPREGDAGGEEDDERSA